MRRFTKILGFVAVSFVLVFISKVNKTGLFTAYVKTIADVEIRNSQAVKFGDAAVVAPVTEVKAAPNSLRISNAGMAALLSFAPEISNLFRLENEVLPISPLGITPFGLRACQMHAPRAPSA